MVRIAVRIGGGICGLSRVENRLLHFSERVTLEKVMQELAREVGRDVLRDDVMVIVNGRAVQKEKFSQYRLEDGDVVAVIRAVAGG